MAAVNKDPFIRTKNKDGLPNLFMGKVQAGTTQAIKVGEICAYNKTAGYWVPVSAVADFIYALAIAKEEQKAADLARYITFYSLGPNDEFEFELAAARSLALGDNFILTASDSQKLTYSATAFPVCSAVDFGHYPEIGTTIPNQSYATVIFNPAVTHYGLISPGNSLGTPKIVTSTAALTLYAEQSGLIISNLGASGATIHVLPQSCPAGTTFQAIVMAAQDNGFELGAAGAAFVEGAKQTDDKNVSVDDEGDAIRVIHDGNGDWFCECAISSTAEIMAVVDVEG